MEMKIDNTVSVIIPTCNGEKEIGQILQMLSVQSRIPDEVIVVDSSSEDRTVSIVKEFAETKLLQIPRSEFNHGMTRDWAMHQTGSDFVIFLTQDAIPADENYIENILAPFQDPQIAAVSGRQLPKTDARPFEQLVRQYNYPDTSSVWSASDKASLGIRAYALSDANCAYRKTAYSAVGGFDRPVPTNEDMLIAEKFLRYGYKLAYSADAAVYHSHNFTLSQQYRRYYLIGKVLKQYESRFDAEESGYGMRFAVFIFCKLLQKGRIIECAAFFLDCAARYLGNKKGKHSV